MSDITCLAFLAADRIWIENNGKIGMVGIFENFSLPKFPAQVMPFSLYVRLGNVPKGKNVLSIDIVNKQSNLLISNMKAEIDVGIEKSIIQLPVPVPPLTLPAPGEYLIKLIANSEKIAEYVLHANLTVVGVKK